MTETEVRKQIKEYLQLCGWYVWPTHLHNGKRNPATRGISDFEAVKDGRFIAVEVKGKIGEASIDQYRHASLLFSHGVDYFIVHDVDELAKLVVRNEGAA